MTDGHSTNLTKLKWVTGFAALMLAFSLAGCLDDDDDDDEGSSGELTSFDPDGIMDEDAAVTEDNIADVMNTDVRALLDQHYGFTPIYIELIEDIVLEVTDQTSSNDSGDFEGDCPEGGSVSSTVDSFASDLEREYVYEGCAYTVSDDGPEILAGETIVIDGYHEVITEFDDSPSDGSTRETIRDTDIQIVAQDSDEILVGLREDLESLVERWQQEDGSWELDANRDLAILELRVGDDYVAIEGQEVSTTGTAVSSAGGGAWYFDGLEGEVTEEIAAYGSTYVGGSFSLESTESWTYGPEDCSFTGDPECDFRAMENHPGNSGVWQIQGADGTAEFRFGENAEQDQVSVHLDDRIIWSGNKDGFRDDWDGWIIRR